MTLELANVWHLQEKGAVGLRAVSYVSAAEYARGARATSPVSFRASDSTRGDKIHDWVFTEHLEIHLVSSRVVELLETHRVTGWCTYPIELTDRNNEPVTGYFGLGVTGRCGPLEDGPATGGDPPSSRFRRHRGFTFEVGTWNGKEIFIPEEAYMVLFTERVMRLLVDARIKNIAFERLTEIDHPVPVRMSK